MLWPWTLTFDSKHWLVHLYPQILNVWWKYVQYFSRHSVNNVRCRQTHRQTHEHPERRIHSASGSGHYVVGGIKHLWNHRKDRIASALLRGHITPLMPVLNAYNGEKQRCDSWLQWDTLIPINSKSRWIQSLLTVEESVFVYSWYIAKQGTMFVRQKPSLGIFGSVLLTS